jgi:hypothetical protein
MVPRRSPLIATTTTGNVRMVLLSVKKVLKRGGADLEDLAYRIFIFQKA